jgi:hypothetical protein
MCHHGNYMYGPTYCVNNSHGIPVPDRTMQERSMIYVDSQMDIFHS